MMKGDWKKYFNYGMLSASMLLTSCSADTDAVIDGIEPSASPTEEYTSFSSTSEADTRTVLVDYMDGGVEKYRFDWTQGDKIFIKHEDGDYRRSDRDNIQSAQRDAIFHFTGHYTADTYPIYYTGFDEDSQNLGNNGEEWNRVTIKSKQIQYEGDHARHMRYSGDCGTAIATKKAGSGGSAGDDYEFTLEHKASYIVFRPKTSYTPTVPYCNLLKITVKDLDGNSLAGTYEFGDSGLNTSSVTGASDQIDLYLSERLKEDGTVNEGHVSNFKLTEVANHRAYMVLQPGTHRLQITYTLAYFRLQLPKFNGSRWEYDHTDRLVEISKTVETTFEPNYLYPINHTLDLSDYEPSFTYNYDLYYQWGAIKPFWEGVAVENRSSKNNHDVRFAPDSGSLYDTAGTANASLANMPTVNEMTQYMVKGDLHHDTQTLWWLQDYDGGYTLSSGGVWLLKRQFISGFDPNENAFVPGFDLERTGIYDNTNYRVYYRNLTAEQRQKPADVTNYFFLPRLGYFETMSFSSSQIKAQMKNMGAEGKFITKSINPNNNSISIYTFYIMDKPAANGGQYVSIGHNNNPLNYGFIGGLRPDGTNWFQ